MLTMQIGIVLAVILAAAGVIQWKVPEQQAGETKIYIGICGKSNRS